jgi:hypothetical protein
MAPTKYSTVAKGCAQILVVSIVHVGFDRLTAAICKTLGRFSKNLGWAPLFGANKSFG